MRNNVLQNANSCAMIDANTAANVNDVIVVSRSDLETEHRQLLSRLHHIRRLLGYSELQTGRKRRANN